MPRKTPSPEIVPGKKSSRCWNAEATTRRAPRSGRVTRYGGPVLLFWLLLCAPLARLEAQLQSLDLDQFQIVTTGEAFSYVVPHIAECAENALIFHQELYDWQHDEPIKFLLEDFSDFGHGGANTVPSNFINLGVAPFSYVYGTVPAIDRMFWMANHEMAHIVTMDQAAGRDLTFRKLFGGKVDPIADNPLSILYNYWTNPRWNAPRWYHEGIAVFLETWMAGGLGRAQGAYDEMVFRSMVDSGARFYDVVGLESEGTTIDFQVGVNSYLYGTRFMTYLARTYGPETVIEWTGRRPGSKAHFAAQFRNVYGTGLDEEWRKWIEFEKGWQRANLEAIRQNPTTEYETLARTPLGSVSRTFVDPETGRLLVAIRYPGQLAHIAAFDPDTGDLEKLTNVKGAAIFYVTSLAFDAERRRLFYTTDNYGWRDLYSYDLETREKTLLQKNLRAGDLAFSAADRTLWGVRHFNGISTLIRMDEPWNEWDQVYSFPYGRDLYDIDVSPDGRWLTGALARIDGNLSLVRFDLRELAESDWDTELEPETLFDFETSALSNFVFSPDGRSLYGSSYYSGVSNLFRYDLETEDMVALTNTDTGFFRPLPLGDGEILAFRYTGQGFLPVRLREEPVDRVSAVRFLGTALAREHPVVREWKAPPPGQLQTMERAERNEYRSLRRLRLSSFYPVVEGYKDSAAAGFRFNFSDGFDLTTLDLTVAYSDDDELEDTEDLHASLAFRHWDWSFDATYNATDFYDLFGPTKTSRRGYSVGVGYDKTLFYDEPRALRFHGDVTGWGDLETLPEFQEIEIDADKLLQVNLSLDYEHKKKSLGAVDEESGVRWELAATTNVVDGGDTSPRLRLDFDRGFPLALDHSSIWIRTSVGQGFGDRDDPFSQFFFGGFGNNWVDHLTEKRYRESYAFPGIDINEAGGRNYGKLTLEWNLPPVRFRSVGVPSFYLNWLRPAIFVGGLQTDLDESLREQTWYDAGVQLDFRLVMFSNLSATLSLGYAQAWLDGGDSQEEWLVSLKIL